MNFQHFTPTRIIFGRGALSSLGSGASALGRRPLLVTGKRFARSNGLLQRVCEELRRHHLEAEVFDGVSPNPRSDEVDAAVSIARRAGCDLVIGLGGGSALDAAKAAAASIERDSVRELIGVTLPLDATALPIIAVPTTAGTGSEVTKGAIVHDVVRNLKAGVRGECLYPQIAIIDPELSEGMPPSLARQTAFDSLTHAVESYVGRSATVLTDALAEKAIRLFAAHASDLGRGGAAGAAAHDAMCMTALLGGINVGNASTCAPHRLQQALAGVKRIEISHPQGLAAIYPSWLTAAQPYTPRRFADLAGWLGWRAADLPQAMAGLVEAMDMKPSLAAWGYRDDDIATVLGGLTGNLSNDPIEDLNPGRVSQLYLQALR